MNDQSREDLDDRKHAEAEGDLAHQEGIFDNDIGGTAGAVAKEEPGNDATHQPEDKRDVGHGLGFEGKLENE